MNLASYSRLGGGLNFGIGSSQDGNNRVDGVTIILSSSNLALRKEVSDSLSETSSSSISTSTGYHYLKYVKDLSTNFYFYDNQYSVTAASAFTSSLASINLHATARSVDESIDARFDWIRVRKYASTEPEISAQNEEYIHGIGGGLVAHYLLDGNAFDVFNINNGAMSGGTWSEGKYNQAFELNGNSGINAGNGSNLALTSNLAISAWIYPLDRNYFINYYGLMAPIVSREGGGYSTANYGIQLTSATRLSFVHRNAGGLTYEHFDTTQSLLNSWHHVAASVNNNIVSMYLDGALLGTSDAGEDGGIKPTSTYEQVLRIGGLNGYGFVGSIDDVRIYNKALSQKEIYDLYANPLR
jgi:hypothetical protein